MDKFSYKHNIDNPVIVFIGKRSLGKTAEMRDAWNLLARKNRCFYHWLHLTVYKKCIKYKHALWLANKKNKFTLLFTR
jgi:hypothetical protein